MTDIEDLRERLVGQRFYDKQEDETFTVVGITGPPALALLQYDDGVGWDEAASNFTVDKGIARKSGLDEYGLDSERYSKLGPGPRIDQICYPEEHDWFPWPDDLWQDIPSGDQLWHIPGDPRDFYSRITRCRRCGLSGVSPASSATTGRVVTTRRRGSATSAATSCPVTISDTSATSLIARSAPPRKRGPTASEAFNSIASD